MKESENFALNQWLSYYPENLSYEAILECLNNSEHVWSHENISVWQVVENFPLSQVAEFIEDTKNAFEQAIKNLQEVTQ